MESLKQRWYGLQSREQFMLLLLAVCAVVFMLFMLVVMPLQQWREDEARRLEGSANQLEQVRELVAQVKAKETAPQSAGASRNLSVLVNDSLRKNNLAMRGFQPGSNNDARLRLENVAYQSLAQWLYELEYQHNILVQELSLTPAQSPGFLMVNMRVRQ